MLPSTSIAHVARIAPSGPIARARTSPLVERLLGRELDAHAPMRRTCPPGGASDELVRAIVEWIETGARED